MVRWLRGDAAAPGAAPGLLRDRSTRGALKRDGRYFVGPSLGGQGCSFDVAFADREVVVTRQLHSKPDRAARRWWLWDLGSGRSLYVTVCILYGHKCLII